MNNTNFSGLSSVSAGYIGITSVQAVTGVVGNVFILFVIGSSRSLHIISSVFTALLALFDLGVCLSLLPLIAVSSTFSMTNTPTWQCNLAGCFYIYFRWGALMLVSVISVDRCIAIRTPLRYQKLVTKERAAGAAIFVIIGAGLLALLPIFGVGEYVYVQGRAMCVPAYQKSIAHTLILLVFAACGPIAVTWIAYGVVAKVAIQTAKRGQMVCDENNCTLVTSRKDEIKPVQTLFTITGVYAVCWVPYIGVNLWSLAWRTEPPLFTQSLTECLVVSSSVINPWINSLLDRAFRDAITHSYVKLKSRVLRGRDVRAPRVSSKTKQFSSNAVDDISTQDALSTDANTERLSRSPLKDATESLEVKQLNVQEVRSKGREKVEVVDVKNSVVQIYM